jgi:hypothetical protein
MNIQQLVTQYQDILHKEQKVECRRLNDYQASLAALVEQHARARPGPTKPLTIPVIFGRSHDENFISDYLAYVLDPAKNGIGDAPLAELLRLCDIDTVDLPLAEVTVHREYPLESGRIDLLLEWEDVLVLGIESKIFSPEGAGQTVYYARVMRELFEDTPYHLVYLTRGGWKASSRRFQPVSYEQLLSAFRNVSLPSDVDMRQRVLWEDFLEHLEVYIVMAEPDHFEFSEKARLYIEHQGMIQDLEAAFKREWASALAYIEQQVYAQLQGGPWETYFNTNRYVWHKVFKPAWNQPKLSVHYEYHFAQSSFEKGELGFSVDAERARASECFDLFDQRYPSLEATYRERGILYRPPNRRIAIAWKTYPISQDIEQIALVFVEALAEHRFLESEIDAVVAELG